MLRLSTYASNYEDFRLRFSGSGNFRVMASPLEGHSKPGSASKGEARNRNQDEYTFRVTRGPQLDKKNAWLVQAKMQ